MLNFLSFNQGMKTLRRTTLEPRKVNALLRFITERIDTELVDFSSVSMIEELGYLYTVKIYLETETERKLVEVLTEKDRCAWLRTVVEEVRRAGRYSGIVCDLQSERLCRVPVI